VPISLADMSAVGDAAAAREVHGDQIEEGADRVPEIPAPLVHPLLQLKIGQEEEHHRQQQARQTGTAKGRRPRQSERGQQERPSRSPKTASRSLLAR
jgi:hypothetical protein